MTPAFWRELQEILDRGFTGELTLHCHQGRVVRYEKRETLRPKGQENGERLAQPQRKT